jgi:uncharacterized protein YegJ (DUF2314 family)
MSASANLGQGIASSRINPFVQPTEIEKAVSDAEAAARRHFDSFLTHVSTSHEPLLATVAVRIALPAKSGERETVWITSVEKRSDGSFVGTRGHSPKSGLVASEAGNVIFTRSQVRDWSFVGPDNRLYGSFTARALSPYMPLGSNDRMVSILSESPLPEAS